MIRFGRERFIGIAITSERGGNQSSMLHQQKGKRACGHAATLISIFSSFFHDFRRCVARASVYRLYSVERRQLNLSSATGIQILIMYRLFTFHPPFSFVPVCPRRFPPHHRINNDARAALDDLIDSVYDVPEAR
jgi:hypothetical protein